MQEKKMDEKKVREAIEELKDDINIYEFMIRDNKGFTSLCVKLKAKIEKLKTAIEALEKQLPKKPTYDGDGYAPDGTFIWDEWLCPNCGSRYEVDYDDYSYCPNCGQRLDWSE